MATDEEDDDRNYDTMTGRAMTEILNRYRDLRLAPGRAFTENELVEELGLSKTPVREALLMLGVHGYVVPRPRTGYRVSAITVNDVREICDVLRALAPAAAAALAAKGLVTENFCFAVEDTEECITGRTDTDIDDIVQARVGFFFLVVRQVGNRRLARLFAQQMNDFGRTMYMVLRGGGLAQRPSGQAEVLAALRAGDADAAAKAMHALIDAWEEALVSALLDSPAVMNVNVTLPKR